MPSVLKRRKPKFPLILVKDVKKYISSCAILNDVTWLSSHLDSQYIIWSSHPTILSISKTELNTNPTTISCCTLKESLSYARSLVNENKNILIIAGAGCSTDCKDEHGNNLPDYRSSGVPVREELDDPALFLSNPSLIWGIYTDKMKLFLNGIPHQGYEIMFKYLKNSDKNFYVMTSNIDCQFSKSGYKHIYECHGALNRLQCCDLKCKQPIWNINSINDFKYYTCETCKKIARPNVSMHMDTNLTYNNTISTKQKRNLLKWIKNRNNLLIIEIGCGQSIHSLRLESDYLLEKYPSTTKLVRINNSKDEQNFITDKIVSIQCTAEQAMCDIFSDTVNLKL
ncbi:unnamed protein product [Didymodactylos carnosus]|uniref:Deacetylase sirtuin-type domain-containing protein n=1 Tax=Didymodactylos carnosus TaxID=1234261 RepID=A0A815HIV3_9BILA|nr:unnamed protein product [Didymodactylos carnosus]CAF1355394.1 unnamed protein product [Didymodactylos carnosus]CAF3804457.1 unnamed protein product [Didymodactylos carnosus]CAF4228585.1 unnamed protein product [Didymodactylos carnosus]